MRKDFILLENRVAPCPEGRHPDIIVYASPTADETRYLVDECGIDEHNLLSSMDPDELARFEVDPDHIEMIFKRPRNYSATDMLVFKAASSGMFLFIDRLVIVIDEDMDCFNLKIFQRVASVREVMLKMIFAATSHFLGHLKVINMISDEIEHKINQSLGNKYLINLFSIEKSLIYYLNSINSNSSLLERIKLNAAKLELSVDELELLDDVIIENQQCYKQAEIYSNILVGMGDARASIVNNNLNILMKRLTIITIIFAPLNFLAGVGGMSEFSMMTQGVDWRITYSFFTVVMVFIALFMYFVIKRIERREGK